MPLLSQARRRTVRVVAFSLVLVGFAALGLSHSQAQDQPLAVPEKAQGSGRKLVRFVVDFLTRQSGVLVVADSTVENENAAMPPDGTAITAQNMDDILAKMVEALPEGVHWAKLYLPPPPKGKKWTGEDVAAYALAQARLFGNVGGDDTPGYVEILGQKVPTAQAQTVITTLNLRPVYLVTRRTGQGTFQGVWGATFGELRLRVRGTRVTGTYTANDGEIEGRLVRGVLEFTWHEKGNDTSGPGRFVLSDDGNSFTGVWWYNTDDPETPGREWVGKRTGYVP